jgi:SAM-dependent methyltransferase
MTQTCPLCENPNIHIFDHASHRTYFHCPVCRLIFVDRDDLLTFNEERARYDLHQNHLNDPDYRNFLNQLAGPLLNRLDPPPLKGLDFGSGPGPTLSIMLAEHGYPMRIYDPFYAPNPQVLQDSYDFITCSEAFEHLYTPRVEWRMLVDLLKPGGWLGIMTLLFDFDDDFSSWHYKNDLTHVSFFSKNTFQYLAQQDEFIPEFIGNNVILFQKPGTTHRPKHHLVH